MTYTLRAARSPSDPDAAVALALLENEFGPRGELERREVIEGWLAEPPAGVSTPDGLVRAYRLLVARDGEGTVAGVRDLHVVVDPAARVVVVYLAHVLVVPAFRRAGVGARLRGASLDIAADLARAHGDGPFDTLVAAEMEHPDPADAASVVRLVAYGREGFRAVDPTFLPYVQPDFRALGPDDVPSPIPLLAVVRREGHDDAAALPASLARAFVQHLYAVFATHVPVAHREAARRGTLGVLASRLAATGAEEVPLLTLPRDANDTTALRPLARAPGARSS